ncbi:unnamed protein product [Meloidogyne enterolobii]|uniref:Uncharacterized protein n=1 Tax=Meloidogyne enterolobii TaxID=390850 RepID=A0ACB0Y8B2_MELEN
MIFKLFKMVDPFLSYKAKTYLLSYIRFQPQCYFLAHNSFNYQPKIFILIILVAYFLLYLMILKRLFKVNPFSRYTTKT